MRTTNDDLIRCHIWLDRETKEKIDLYYGDSIGFSRAIRMLLKKTVDTIEAEAQKKVAQPIIQNLESLE